MANLGFRGNYKTDLFVSAAVLLQLYFLVAATLASNPVGNPALPFLLEEGFVLPDTSWTSAELGFTGDYVFQKRFRASHSSRHTGLSDAAVFGPSEVGSVAWQIRDRLNLQASIGSSQCSFGWKQENQMVLGGMSGGILWGGDAKYVLLNVKDTFLAIDAQAGGADGMSGSMQSNGVSLEGTSHSHVRYWQCSVACTQKISFFAPYAGIAVNHSRWKVVQKELGARWLRSRHEVGPFLGCSFSTGNALLLNLEWRGWFEEGVAASMQCRF